MASWSDYLTSAGGSAVGGIISGLFGNSQQKKQNKFAAEQAELDREFQAEQAQLANEFTTSERLASQQWEEDWYNNYSSPQAMVAQYEEAGLNPALMYGSAGASTGDTPSAPSGESGAYASGSKATPLQGLSALDYLQFAVDSFDKIVGAFGRIKENRHKDIENEYFESMLQGQIEKQNTEIQLNVANANLAGVKSLTEKGRQKYLNVRSDEILQNIENLGTINEKLKKEIESLDYDVRKKAAEASVNWFIDLDYVGKSTVNELNQMKIVTEKAQQLLLDGKTSEAWATVDSLQANTEYRKYCNYLLEQCGYEPGMSLQQAGVGLAVCAFKGITDGVNKVIDEVSPYAKNFHIDFNKGLGKFSNFASKFAYPEFY